MNEFMAHEVRNPLSVAVGALRFASDAADKGQVEGIAADLDMVRSSLEYIDALLSNQLDLSKCIAGKIFLQPKRVSLLNDVLMPAARMFSSREGAVPRHGPCLTVVTCDLLWVEADALRVTQVLVNLIKNSLKFCTFGFVRIGAARTAENMVSIWVEDSGPGIDSAKAADLFQKYTQLESVHAASGTGLGLALCKQIAELMGGSIKVDVEYRSGSPYGRGTRFVVDLPLPSEEAPSTTASCSGSSPNFTRLRGRFRVLVVDDDSFQRQIVRRTIDEITESFIVDEATHGEACVEMATAPGAAYDLIIIGEEQPHLKRFY